MSVLIPANRATSATYRPVRYSGDQEAPLGGATLPVSRMGDRWALDVTTSVIGPGAETNDIGAALLLALDQDAAMLVPQPGIDIGNPGFVSVVDGSGQTGSSIKIRLLTPGYVIRKFQFFSIVHNGVHRLMTATAQVTVGGDGKATVPIWPMLRFITVDGAIADFVPKIEGVLSGFDGRGLTRVRAKTQPISFTITERE